MGGGVRGGWPNNKIFYWKKFIYKWIPPWFKPMLYEGQLYIVFYIKKREYNIEIL